MFRLIIVNTPYFLRTDFFLKFICLKKKTFKNFFFKNYKIYTNPISFFIKIYSQYVCSLNFSISYEFFKVNNLMRYDWHMFEFYDSSFFKFVF